MTVYGSTSRTSSVACAALADPRDARIVSVGHDGAVIIEPPSFKLSGQTEIRTELTVQIELLATMFNDPGLTALRRRNPGHPAVTRHDSLVALRDASTSPDTEHLLVTQLAGAFMDRTTWVPDPTVRPFWEASVPDDAQRVQVLARMLHPEQFDDVMLELYVWGRFKTENLAASLQENEGEPDIRIAHPNGEVWTEVKRIHLGSSQGRARAVIAKSNSQIKTVSPGRAGILYMFIETNVAAAAFDDAVPGDVAPFLAEVRRSLGSKDDKHVGQVIVAWDDVMAIGQSPDPTMYVVRRRAHVVSHAHAVSEPVLSDDQLTLGQSFVTWISYRPAVRTERMNAIVSDGLVISEQFRQRNAWSGGIRPIHARGVLERPDGWQETPIGEMKVVLVTRRIDLGRNPNVTLLMGTRGLDGELTLADGYRLRGSEAELEAMKSTPAMAFGELLRRFGIRVRVGDQHGLFLRLAEAGAPQPIEIAADENVPFSVSAFVRSQPGRWEASWVFAIDDGRYRAAVGA